MIQSSKKFLPFAFARFLPACINFVAVPIVLKNSGFEIFSIVTLVFAFLSIQILVDFGLTNSFFPIFVQNISEKNSREARLIFTSTLIRLITSSAIFTLLTLPLVFIFIDNFSGNISKNLMFQFKVAMYLVAISNLFGGLVNFANKILLAYGKNRLSSLLNGLTNSMAAVLMILCSTLKNSLVPITLCMVCIPIVSSLLILIRISKKEMLIDVQNFSWKNSDFGKRNQVAHWMIQAGAILSVQFDAIILAMFSNPLEVARYGVLSKVFLFLLSVYTWASAHHSVNAIRLANQGKNSLLHFELIHFMRRLFLLGIAIALPAILILKKFLNVITEEKFNYSIYELAIAWIWFLSLTISTRISHIMYAQGIFKGYFQLSMSVTLVNIFLTLIFCSLSFGITAPLMATSLSILFISLPMYFRARVHFLNG